MVYISYIPSSLTAIQTTLSSPSPSILTKQNMELELSLRSFFPAEEKYGISLSRLEDDDEDDKHEQELESEEERQLELCPFSKVETQHCHSSSSAPLLKLRFRRQNEIIGENQVFRSGLLDVNNIPSPEAEIDEAAGVVAADITSQTILSNSSTHYERQNSRGDEFMLRKKLRLSKDQSAYLEATFKHNTTLNPRLKVDLAKKLNLRTRQVEVWFQNRRARTKMKQTEVECEYLKRLCEKLMEENLKLQKEVKGLKAMKSSQPFSLTGFNTVSATTLTVCSSCVTTTTVADSAPSTASLATDNCDSGSTSAKDRILQQKKTRSYAIS